MELGQDSIPNGRRSRTFTGLNGSTYLMAASLDYDEIMIFDISRAKVHGKWHFSDPLPALPKCSSQDHAEDVELRHQPIADVCRYCSAELYPLPGLCENQLAGELRHKHVLRWSLKKLQACFRSRDIAFLSFLVPLYIINKGIYIYIQIDL